MTKRDNSTKNLTREEQDRILAAHGITEIAPDELPIFDGEDFIILKFAFPDTPDPAEQNETADEAWEAGR